LRLAVRHPEAALQRTIAAYLSWALAPPAYWSAIGHGGGGQMRGRILKGMGVKAGLPDILIVHDGIAHWIELKAEKGVLSDAQIVTHAALRAAKCPVAVVRSLDELRLLLAGPWWPIPLRESKPATERIKRGIVQPRDWPESDQLRRKRRAKA
jgi:hypothetical protein